MSDGENGIKLITKHTAIPLGLLIAFVTGIAWIVTLNAKSEETSKNVERLEMKNDQYVQTLDEINSRLSRIEGKLGIDGSR